MQIISPIGQSFPLQKAHDNWVMQSTHALARSGQRVMLVVGKKAGYSPERLLTHYGLPPHPNFQLQPLPFLQWRGRLRFSWRWVFNSSLLWRLYRLSRTQNIDCLLLSELPTALFLLRYKNIVSLPIIYECHDLQPLNMINGCFTANPREIYLFSQVKAIVTTTEMLADAIRRIYQVKVPIGVISLAATIQPEMILPVSRNICQWIHLCYIGQLYPLQGVDILIRVLGRVTNSSLTVIGGAAKDIRALRHLAVQEGVADRVHFRGFVPPPAVYELASKADILVMPSRSKGRMPYVAHTKVYEYLALGKPIIASDLSSVREVLRHQENAWLVEPENMQALVEAITLLATERELACSLATQARKEAEKYSWERRSEAFISFLQRVL